MRLAQVFCLTIGMSIVSADTIQWTGPATTSVVSGSVALLLDDNGITSDGNLFSQNCCGAILTYSAQRSFMVTAPEDVLLTALITGDVTGLTTDPIGQAHTVSYNLMGDVLLIGSYPLSGSANQYIPDRLLDLPINVATSGVVSVQPGILYTLRQDLDLSATGYRVDISNVTFKADIAPVPEPAGVALLLIAFAIGWVMARERFFAKVF